MPSLKGYCSVTIIGILKSLGLDYSMWKTGIIFEAYKLLRTRFPPKVPSHGSLPQVPPTGPSQGSLQRVPFMGKGPFK